jgi:hypothetical protein
VQVPKPGGTDDTATIQAALDACVKHGAGCVVSLEAGTYRTSQLVAYDFRGTFKGAGADRTIIEALPDLPVAVPDFTVAGECMPNLTDCVWPSLMLFVDGAISISDLAIHVTATDGHATVPWTIGGSSITSLVDALRFMGQRPTDVAVDRVAIVGRHDTAATSFDGFNVINGILFAGELPRSSTVFDYYMLGGAFAVRSSSFKTLDAGVGVDGFLAGVKGTIGGSKSAGNEFTDVNTGISLMPAQASVFDVSFNTSSSNTNDLWMGPWVPDFVPASASKYAIHDNTFGAAGILLEDDTAHHWIDATITHNTVTVRAPHTEGIRVRNTIGTTISGNTVTGTAAHTGIGLYGVTNGSVTGNAVTRFTLDPNGGSAQIYLDAASAKDRVACSSSSDTVLDQGTGNAVAGCKLSHCGDSRRARWSGGDVGPTASATLAPGARAGSGDVARCERRTASGAA